MLRKNIFKALSILALYFCSHLNDIIKETNKKQTPQNQNNFKRYPEIINLESRFKRQKTTPIPVVRLTLLF